MNGRPFSVFLIKVNAYSFTAAGSFSKFGCDSLTGRPQNMIPTTGDTDSHVFGQEQDSYDFTCQLRTTYDIQAGPHTGWMVCLARTSLFLHSGQGLEQQ